MKKLLSLISLISAVVMIIICTTGCYPEINTYLTEKKNSIQSAAQTESADFSAQPETASVPQTTETAAVTEPSKAETEPHKARRQEPPEKEEDKNPDEKTVYLTFDDGPSPITPKILDVLDEYSIKATFFVTGTNTEYADYIKIAHDKGHTIGMHTYSHDYSKVYSSVDGYYDDLNKIADLCEEQIGFKPKYIRFPGGSSNTVSENYSKGIMTTLTKDVQEKGYQYYDWNCDCGDAGGNLSAKELVKNAKESNGIQNIVMLCHDAGTKQSTVDALPQIIEFYRSQGYTFRAIDDNAYTSHHKINN